MGFKFAKNANNYYLYAAPVIKVFTDCSALEGIFNKNLGDIQIKRIRDMIERMMCYNFKFHHIPGKQNSIADCFSRLTRRIREAEHFSISEPILVDHATIKKIGIKTKIQVEDPWVEKLAKSASLDINYNIMIQYLETKTDISKISNDCELKNVASYYRKLSVLTLKDGHNIILKDKNEILVPEKER